MPFLVLLVLRWVMVLGPSLAQHLVWGSFSEGNLSRVILLVRNKDALVVDHMVTYNDKVLWDTNFFRLGHDWELDFASSLFNAMYSVSMGRGDEEKLCWNPLKRRSFLVKTFYKVLLPNDDSSFPWKSSWRSRAPFRGAFFTWTTFPRNFSLWIISASVTW